MKGASSQAPVRAAWKLVLKGTVLPLTLVAVAMFSAVVWWHSELDLAGIIRIGVLFGFVLSSLLVLYGVASVLISKDIKTNLLFMSGHLLICIPCVFIFQVLGP